MIPLMSDANTLRDFLEHHGIEPSKAMGQNFLVSQEVIEGILAVALEGPKLATELGPGAGALTQGLVESGFTLKAIEKDADFAKLLPSLVSAKKRKNLQVICDDLKDVSWSHTEPYQVIGNIPYNISGYIFRTLTQLEPVPTQAILLVQKEVGQRAVATTPDMNLLSLSISLWGTAEKVLNVPLHCFWPQPDVHSQVLLLRPHQPTHMNAHEHEQIMATARTFFQQKRKQVGGILRKEFNFTADQVRTIVEKTGISINMRPQEISPQQWRTLSDTISQEKR